MANVIKIKAGSGVPTTSNIVDRELAFDRSNNKLYINDSGTIVDLTGQAGGGPASTADRIEFTAQAGEALSKGDVVYISGLSGNTPVVSKADADDANKMPAFGLASSSASLNNSVDIVTFGVLENLDTSAFTQGDTLFVSTTPGGLTATKPTGETGLIQNIAYVVRSAASVGAVKIGGAGRTAATPNLNQDKIFLGNASNQSTPTALSSVNLTKFNNDLWSGSANQLLTNDGDGTATSESNLTFDGDFKVAGTLSTLETVNFDQASGDTVVKISGTGNQRLEFRDTATGANAWIGIPSWNDDAFYLFGPTATSNEHAYTYESSTHRFYTGSSEQLAIFSNGAIDMSGYSVADRHLEIGSNRQANGYAYIDLIGDTTYTDFGARFIRENTGPNTGTAIEHRGTGVLSLNAKDAGSVRFYTSNTERVRIDSSGNVSIGNISASRPLQIGFTTTNGEAIKLDGNASYGASIYYSRGGGYNWNAGVGGASSSASNIPASYWGVEDVSQGNAVRLAIAHTTGNVGIGTTSPGYKLSVENELNVFSSGDTASPKVEGHLLRVTDTTNDNPDIEHFFVENHGLAYGMRWLYDGGANTFSLFRHDNSASGNEVLRFNRANSNVYIPGNVGIGTASPNTLLHLYSTSNTQLRLQTTGTNNASSIVYQNGTASYSVGINSAEQFSFYSSQLGSDAGFINTNGNLNWNHNLLLNANHKFIYAKDTNGTNTRIFGLNNSNTTYIGPIDAYAGGRMYYGASANMSGHNFYTGGTLRMKLDGYVLDLPNTGDWSSILNNTNSGGLRFGSKDAGGTLAYQIEISNTGNYVKLNENTTVTGNITVSGTVDGRDVASDGSKLDGIESGATADQSASEILTAIKTVDGSASGLDADTLDGVQGSSFVRSNADDSVTGIITFEEAVNMNATDSTERLYFKNNGTTVGDIGTNDTTWLRINQSTAKNIYTPRYIRADSGFFVDGATQGITGDGVFRAPNGSVGTPTYSFSSDTNTGMYLMTGDQIGFSTGGVIRASITNNGINTLNGNGYYIDDRRIYEVTSNSTERGGFHPIIASIRNSGKQRYLDEDFNYGTNSVILYNNAGGTNLVVSRITASDDGIVPPNSSGKVIKVAYNGNGTTSPGFGGVYQLIQTEKNHTFVQIFQAKLPAGRTFVTAANSMGTNSTDYFLTSPEGTGKWEWYARVCHAGDGGTFSTSGFIYVTGGSDTAFTWYIANMTQYDVTETPGDYTSQTGYYRSNYNVNATLARGLNDDDRIVIEASETKVIGDTVERARFGSYGIRNNVVGSEGSPSYSFVSDTNTGMLRTAENTIGFSTGGSTRFTMNGSGVFYASSAIQAGNAGVQIWDGTHGFKTVLAKDSTYTKLLNNDGTVMMYMGDSGDAQMYYQGNEHRFRNLSGSAYYARIGSGYIRGEGGGSVGTPQFSFQNDPDTGMYSLGADDLGFSAGGVLRYGILNGLNRFYANVVVGPNNNNSKPYIQYKDGYDTASTPSYSWYFDNGCGIGHPAGSVIAFSTGSAERARITNTGLSVDGNITMQSGHYITAHNESSYQKYDMYAGSGSYCIGMKAGNSFGGLNDWAMTFTFYDTQGDRGFLWRSTAHSTSQGAMSLTTGGKLSVAHSTRIGYGISDITTSGATYALDVSGSIGATADVVAYVSSDKRLKDNIKNIANPLEKLEKLNGIEFDWNDKQDLYEGHDIGVIAQEVEEVLPEIVDTREDGHKAVKYDRMVALLIEAVKEQQQQINELKEKLNG